MNVFHLLVGTTQMKIVSAEPEWLLQKIHREGIITWEVKMLDPITWQFIINSGDKKRIEQLVAQNGGSCESAGTLGVYGIAKRIMKRPILILGIFIMVVLSFWIPSKVLFVRVEGCKEVAPRLILQEAEKCGIFFCAERNEIRSEQVKNKLLSQIPQLQWAGVRTVGCVAVITVTEKKTAEENRVENEVCSIVAARDGVISEITILRGNGLCRPGQAVKAGQVLISGYTDCGICIQAQRAEGEILAHTKRDIRVISPTQRTLRLKMKESNEKISLIIGKKVINFSKGSGILGGSCAKIYERKYINLPGGFILPISILRERWIEYDISTDPDSEQSEELFNFARAYVLKQTNAGKIQCTQERLTSQNGYVQLDAVYDCLENIGVIRVEENLLDYGKSNGKNRQCGVH